jgi:Carboxypeptidase regulatory-like domain
MKTRQVAFLLLLACFAVAAYPARAKDNPNAGRLLTGKVIDHEDRPITDAVVYLSDTRTRAVKTYIVGPEGTYSFPALSPNVDYEVYAQYKGHKSDTKTVSQFDDRPRVNINLRIDVK